MKKETRTTPTPPSNVINFPIKQINLAAKETLEELKQQAHQQKTESVTFVVQEIFEELFFRLSSMGIDVSEDRYLKDIIFLEEALTSLLLKSVNIEHPMQQAAEQIVTVVDRNEAESEEE